MKKIFANKIVFVLLWLFAVPSLAVPENNQDVKNYINDLISEGYKILKQPDISNEERFKRTSDAIRANLHLDWMAKHTLGRNKNKLSPAQLKDFIGVYSDFIVNAYAELSSNYNGEKAVIKGIRPVNDSVFTVSMEIVKAGSHSPVKVDYLVHKVGNVKGKMYKVADVITENVSILNSQEAEFSSVIANQGIDALISDLRKKNSDKETKRKNQ